MPNTTYGVSIDGGGVSIKQNVVRSSDQAIGIEVTLPVGYTGTLTTRTDNDTGTVTLDAGHGITTADVVDIYWDGGVQYGVTVGTVSVNSMPFDNGVGDNLPSTSTAVVVTKQVEINSQIDGDNLKILAICLETPDGTSGKGHVDMQSASPATIEEIDLVGNTPRVFDIEGGDTNVFTGNPITTTYASNGSATQAATLKLVAIQDSTP